MHRYQSYVLTLSLIFCLILAFQPQTYANPVETVTENTPSTSLEIESNGNKPVKPTIPYYFFLDPFGMPFPFDESLYRNNL